MAKPEWGMKRTCQGCGTRYYDLRRSPIKCPACGAVFTPEQMPRRRTSAPAAPVPLAALPEETAEPIVAVEVSEEAEETVEVEDVAVEDVEDVEEEVPAVEKEKDKELIEDASDLGEDEDDMSEVKEHLDEGEGPRRP